VAVSGAAFAALVMLNRCCCFRKVGCYQLPDDAAFCLNLFTVSCRKMNDYLTVLLYVVFLQHDAPLHRYRTQRQQAVPP
jgi:hypothetical protein